jgi:hypothetical protein
MIQTGLQALVDDANELEQPVFHHLVDFSSDIHPLLLQATEAGLQVWFVNGCAYILSCEESEKLSADLLELYGAPTMQRQQP